MGEGRAGAFPSAAPTASVHLFAACVCALLFPRIPPNTTRTPHPPTASTPRTRAPASLLYASMIRVHGLHGQLARAKDCLNSAVGRGVPVGLRHYDGVMLAAAVEGRAEEVDSVGRAVVSKGIRRDAMWVLPPSLPCFWCSPMSTISLVSGVPSFLPFSLLWRSRVSVTICRLSFVRGSNALRRPSYLLFLRVPRPTSHVPRPTSHLTPPSSPPPPPPFSTTTSHLPPPSSLPPPSIFHPLSSQELQRPDHFLRQVRGPREVPHRV